MIVDSHCHLDNPHLFDQLDDVVKRAIKNQVKHMLTISTTLESFEKIKIIVEKYKNIYGTVGIHPHETEKNIQIDSKLIKKLKIQHKKIIGIGETGLDFYYNHSDKKIQKNIFIEHIKAASDLKIPLIVHSRNAENETYDILKNEKKNTDLKILMHCFTGSKEFAKKLLDIGCYLSFSGIITFKNANELVNTVSFVPLSRLLVETDSPYLAPVPYRGKFNEPSYINHTISKIAEIKNVSIVKAINETSNNFFKIFKLN